MKTSRMLLVAGALLFAAAPLTAPGQGDSKEPTQPGAGSTAPLAGTTRKPGEAESKSLGGEPAGVVQVANLVYANTKSSKCFSDHFLIQAEQDSSISTS